MLSLSIIILFDGLIVLDFYLQEIPTSNVDKIDFKNYINISTFLVVIQLPNFVLLIRITNFVCIILNIVEIKAIQYNSVSTCIILYYRIVFNLN